MLVSVLSTGLVFCALAIALASVAFALQAGGMFFLRDRPFPVSQSRPSVAVLVPAHNEEHHIKETLHEIIRVLSPADRLVVVADNCLDQTALLAKRAGADVVVRNDAGRRGKGFALEAGLRHISALAPEVVVFIDADCKFKDDGLQLLARACEAANTPVQCLYLMIANPANPMPSRLSEFAWRIKNDFRPHGYSRLGLPCHLLGTGMAIPWRLIKPQLFATGHLTEDLFLGIELAIQGSPPRFFRDARVTSYFPATQRGREQQKQRWVHGHLELITTHLPRLVHQSLRRRDLGLLALAADLAVPPLGILGIANMTVALLCLAHLTVTGESAPLAFAVFGNATFAFSTITAWHLCGRDLVGAGELKRLPGHLLTVIRAALNLARGRRTQWIRADRSENTRKIK